MIEKDAKIYIAGHKGLVGSAILRSLKNKGYTNFILKTHSELDLTDQVRGYRDQMDSEPGRLDMIEIRLIQLNKLRKYGACQT